MSAAHARNETIIDIVPCAAENLCRSAAVVRYGVCVAPGAAVLLVIGCFRLRLLFRRRARFLGLSPTVAGQQQSISWDRARAAISKYRTMIDTSGLVEVGANAPPEVRSDDLQALCTARKQSIERARIFARTGLRGLIPGEDPMTAERQASYERYLGSVASFTGETDLAATHFQAGRDAILKMLPDAPSLKRAYLPLLLALATANMRQGETANCLVTPSGDRCLFPLRPAGVHQHPEGAEHAIEGFTEYLTYEPNDLGVRWLLNLSYMLHREISGLRSAAVPAEVGAVQIGDADAPIRRCRDAHRAGTARHCRRHNQRRLRWRRPRSTCS